MSSELTLSREHGMTTAFVDDVSGALGRRLVRLLEGEGVRAAGGHAGASTDDLGRSVLAADVIYVLGDVDGTNGEPFRAMREANIDGPSRLFELVQDGQRVVFLSSVQVYSPVPPAWPSSITEQHPRRAHGTWPTQVYGQQKIESENRLVRAADRRRFDYVLLRSTLRFDAAGGLPARIVTDAATRPHFAANVHRSLGTMQWVSTDDLCRALVAAGKSRRSARQAFNIAGEDAFTVNTLIDRFHSPLRFRASQGRLQPLIHTAKARSVLGWAPRDRLDDWVVDRQRRAERTYVAASSEALTAPISRGGVADGGSRDGREGLDEHARW
jgi:nucleoside-diphosphate-sugar epimerase